MFESYFIKKLSFRGSLWIYQTKILHTGYAAFILIFPKITDYDQTMIQSIIKNESVGEVSKRQQLFLKFTYFVLLDIVVLNLLNEFWDKVFIEYFYISILTAVLLQGFLQITFAIENRVHAHFKPKQETKHKILGLLSRWAVLVISKLVILESISRIFGHSVTFGGIEHTHGIIIFVTVVAAIIAAEQLFALIFRSLGPRKV